MSLENSNPSQPINCSSAVFYSGMVLNVAQAIIAPASNINGLVVHMFDGVCGDANTSLLSKSSAPTNIADGRVFIITKPIISGNRGAHFEKSFTVPAGQGLYVITDVASTTLVASIQYTLL